MNSFRRLILPGFLVSASAAAISSFAQGAAAPDLDGAARQRIASERAAAETLYSERLQACAGRFVVTSCVESARNDRRNALSRLKHEQQELDDSKRKSRAAERNEAIHRRTTEESKRKVSAEERPPRTDGPHVPLDRPSDRSGRSEDAGTENARRSTATPDHRGALPALVPPTERRTAAAQANLEARSRATFDAAQRATEGHRLEVEARNARRSETHKAAKPLPLPPGASAP